MPLHMRLPKLQGFKNPFRVEFQVVNLDRLAELFPERWRRSAVGRPGRPRVRSARAQPVKVLGNGELGASRCRSRAHAFSRVRQGEDRGCRRLGHHL